MRVLLLIALTCAVLCTSSVSSVYADPDDTALLQLGVHLNAEGTTSLSGTTLSTLPPLPTYVTTRPADHEDIIQAKFPGISEVSGIEKHDWNSIQNLLFKEPVVAAEESLDMKLDELEEKFKKIDAMPIPPSRPPPGSTLLPKKKVVNLGLKATLPNAKKLRLQQLKAKAKAKAKKKAVKKNAPPAAAAPSAAATLNPAAKIAAAAAAAAKKGKLKKKGSKSKKSKKSKKKSKKNKKKKKKSKSKKKAKKATGADAKLAADVKATVATVKLIDKRLKGLRKLFKTLKKRLGMELTIGGKKDRVQESINKYLKDKREHKKRMMMRGARLAQVGMDSEAETEAEQDAEEHQQTMAEVSADVESDSDSDSEVESAAEADAELKADAEVVDELLKEYYE